MHYALILWRVFIQIISREIEVALFFCYFEEEKKKKNNKKKKFFLLSRTELDYLNSKRQFSDDYIALYYQVQTSKEAAVIR